MFTADLLCLLEFSNEAWCIKSVDGRVVYANRSYKKLLSPAHGTYASPLSRFRGIIREHDSDVLKNARGKTAFGLLYYSGNSVNFPFQCERMPIFNTKKQVCGIISHIRPLISVSPFFLIKHGSMGVLTCHKPSEFLSDKEWEIIYLIMQGVSEKNMAEKLHRSLRTIKFHKSNILQKTNCANTSELIEYIEQRKWQYYIPPRFASPCYLMLADGKY